MRPEYKHLPVNVAAALSRLGADLDREAKPQRHDLEEALDGLAKLSPAVVASAAYEIRDAARLGWWTSPRPFLLRLITSRQTPGMLLAAEPRYAWLFLFHGDGRVRQAALERLNEPPAAPFFLAAMAWRLNDWASEVRTAAVLAAERLLPSTSPRIVAAVAMDLLDREFHWSRWTSEMRALNTAFARPDVGAILVDLFLHSPTGPLANRLRYLLRYAGYEQFLPALARQAVQPAVRALALKSLLDGRVSWPVGFEWKWIDKTYGLRRREPAFASRPIQHGEWLEDLIVQGLADRSPVVRRVAADALCEHRRKVPQAEHLIVGLAKDRNPSLRERASYMMRHPLET